MKLNLTNEELDVICLALVDAQDFRFNKKKQTDKKIADVYENIRQKLREVVPFNSSLNKLMKEV